MVYARIYLSVLIAVPVAATFAAVNLSLEPSTLTVSPGEAFSVQLWARSEAAEPFDGIDAALNWDPARLTLGGWSDEGAPYAWSVSDFLAASALNDNWTDGDAIYTCLRPLSGSAPQTDLRITTFEFTASNAEGPTTVTIPTDGDTVVASGGAAVLGTTAGVTVTVQSSNDGDGGSGGTGDDTSQDDDDTGDDTGEDDGDNADESGEDDTGGTDDSDGTDDGSGGEPTESDDGSGDTGTNDEGAGDNDVIVDKQPPVGLCGVGVAETIAMCFAGLCLFSVQRSVMRGVRPSSATRVSGPGKADNRARGGGNISPRY